MGERLLQLGRWRDGLYTEEQVAAVLQGNVESLERMAHTISRKTRLFRLSSNILPLMDIVPRYLWDTPEVRGPLARAGKIFQDAGTRIVSHPGQFCVLSSDSDTIVANAVRELVSHAWVFDAMGLPQTPHALVGGGAVSSRAVSSRAVSSRVGLAAAEDAASLLDRLGVDALL
jgi:UV DNA damage repair endonuclease